jgi:hypothetical protein
VTATWDLVLVGVLVPAMIVGLALLLAHRRRAGGRPLRTYRRFKAFVHAVETDLLRGHSDLPYAYAATTRDGRDARITLSRDVLGAWHARVSVSTSKHAPPLAVRLENDLDRLWTWWTGRREPVVTGNPRFDTRFWLESARPVRGKAALGPEVRQAIDQAFTRYRARDLRLANGALSIELPLANLALLRLRDVLRLLDRVASLVEVRPLAVRVLEGERNALCDEGDVLRCAYCRDGVTGAEPDLIACGTCRTVVHDACWAEHGACPVLGCAGDAAERPRARA